MNKRERGIAFERDDVVFVRKNRIDVSSLSIRSDVTSLFDDDLIHRTGYYLASVLFSRANNSENCQPLNLEASRLLLNANNNNINSLSSPMTGDENTDISDPAQPEDRWINPATTDPVAEEGWGRVRKHRRPESHPTSTRHPTLCDAHSIPMKIDHSPRSNQHAAAVSQKSMRTANLASSPQEQDLSIQLTPLPEYKNAINSACSQAVIETEKVAT